MRILVTGITGFAGSYLAEALLARGGVEIHGLARKPDWPDSLRHLQDRVGLHPCDLAIRGELETVLRAVAPEQIYHLAGYAKTGMSYKEPEAAWEGNLTVTRNVLTAVELAAPRARMLFVGSGLIYGDPVPADRPQDEETVLRPGSPYAASKAAADLACFQATRSPGLHIVCARPFNHIGPRQSAQFAIGNFARQIAAIELGLQDASMETGGLESRRDLTDVRDVVAAYLLLMEKGEVGEAYNIGTGTAVSMQFVIEQLCSLSTRTFAVMQRESLVRSRDTAVILADAGKIRRETGWQPAYSLRQSLSDTLDYWRTTQGKKG